MLVKKLSIISVLFILGGCVSETTVPKKQLSIKVDGSSTVYPITEAVAESFGEIRADVRVGIGVSGTGGGFKKFCLGEKDINDASRHIKGKEVTKCKANNIKYVELPVAYDGVSVLIHNDNSWAGELTKADLKAIWQPESKIKLWSDVRKEWPKKEIKLYGPGSDSGTFDFFTKAINGKEGASRSDYTASENDNIIVNGVTRDKYALGYVGYAYYDNNKTKLKAAKIDGIAPTLATIMGKSTGKRYPLARPIFIYVNQQSALREEVNQFVQFYIKNAAKISKEVGYIPLPNSDYGSQLEGFATKFKVALPQTKKI